VVSDRNRSGAKLCHPGLGNRGLPHGHFDTVQCYATVGLNMRKIVLFVISVAMVVGGLYLLTIELFWSEIIYFRMVIAGAMLITLGSYLLWSDFLAPLLGVRTSEEQSWAAAPSALWIG
jgi:hypothetical protein